MASASSQNVKRVERWRLEATTPLRSLYHSIESETSFGHRNAIPGRKRKYKPAAVVCLIIR